MLIIGIVLMREKQYDKDDTKQTNSLIFIAVLQSKSSKKERIFSKLKPRTKQRQLRKE